MGNPVSNLTSTVERQSINDTLCSQPCGVQNNIRGIVVLTGSFYF